MEASQAWKLFEKTGNIGVYILYKKLSEEKNVNQGGEEIKRHANSDIGNSYKREQQR